MASTTAFCNSFKNELMLGEHDLDTHQMKMALYEEAATHGKGTTAYSATQEISGTNYTAGGENMTGTATYPKLDVDTAIMTFADVVWTTATFTAYSALIYNSSASNKALSVHDFTGTSGVSASGADFTVSMPTADQNDAILRIA